jgi:hypothetical protein
VSDAQSLSGSLAALRVLELWVPQTAPAGSRRSCSSATNARSGRWWRRRRRCTVQGVATRAGLRESRLIGLIVYDFARIGAAWHTVEDVYKQNRRLWVRLREKDGKRHAMPCHHNFEEYLVGYPDGPGCAAIPRAAIPHDRPRPPASSHGRFCRRQTPIR